MYNVSTKFHEAMRARKRRIYAKVEIAYTDPKMDTTINVAANENANISFPAQTADNLERPTRKFASLDGSWDLTEDYELYRPGDQIGWWSEQLADSNGNFTSPYPVLTVTFASRPIREFKVIGDSARVEYPVNFTIKLYDEEDNILHTETVTGNDKVAWNKKLEQEVTEVTKMKLEILKWSHAGRQAKIIEFFTNINEVYEGDDIFSINYIEQKEVSHGSLPIGNISSNEITISLNNKSRKFDAGNKQSSLYNLVKPNRKIKAWLGTEDELVPLGVFWSGDWSVPEDDIYAKTTGRDRLDQLRKTDYTTNTVQINISAYDLFEDILRDAGLVVGEYWIDEELKNIIFPYSHFEDKSHREALRIVAEASLAQVYCDREGVIRVEGIEYIEALIEEKKGVYFLKGQFPAETDVIEAYGIGADDYYKKDNPPRISEIANHIEVETNPLVPKGIEEVYRSDEQITVTGTETITIYYNKSPCIDAVAYLVGTGTIENVNYYAWGAEITVSNGTFEIVVNAKHLVAANKEKAIAEDADSIFENGYMPYKFPSNPLIQTYSRAEFIANKLLQSYKDPKRSLTMEWRGNPALLLNDLISVPDYQKNGEDERGYFITTQQEYDYDGGLEANLDGKRAF